MTENQTKLMDKNVNDLTVGDALKINLVVVAVAVAIPGTFLAGAAIKDKFTNWNQKRKLNKIETAKND